MSSAEQIAFFQQIKRGNGCRRIYLLITNRDEELNSRVSQDAASVNNSNSQGQVPKKKSSKCQQRKYL